MNLPMKWKQTHRQNTSGVAKGEWVARGVELAVQETGVRRCEFLYRESG